MMTMMCRGNVVVLLVGLLFVCCAIVESRGIVASMHSLSGLNNVRTFESILSLKGGSAQERTGGAHAKKGRKTNSKKTKRKKREIVVAAEPEAEEVSLSTEAATISEGIVVLEDEDKDEGNEAEEHMDEEDGEESAESLPPAVARPEMGDAIKNQIITSGVSMAASSLIFKIDMTKKSNLKKARFFFCVYLVTSQLLVVYLREVVSAKNDQTVYVAPKGLMDDLAALSGNSELAEKMKTQAEAVGGDKGGNGNGKKEKTVCEHDLEELSKMTNSLFFEILSTSYMHFISKATKPLMFVPLMGFLNKFKSPQFKSHFDVTSVLPVLEGVVSRLIGELGGKGGKGKKAKRYGSAAGRSKGNGGRRKKGGKGGKNRRKRASQSQ